MVEAAVAGPGRMGYRLNQNIVIAILNDALAAAPAVEDLVWCDGLEDAVRLYHTGGGVESQTAWMKRPCTSTHRTLLLGPEVQA